MITIQLMGGLGNQMFQYACGRALAYKYQTELILDCSFLEDRSLSSKITFRDYELDIFAIKAKRVGEGEFLKHRPSSLYLMYRKLSRLVGLPIIMNRTYFFEQEKFYYNKSIDRISRNCYLTGYWSNEKYFKQIEQLIRQDFMFNNSLEMENTIILNKISTTNSVSLHIRRGDYAENPSINKAHGLCPLEYYEQAILYIAKKISNPIFFIFSDDIEWVQNNLNSSYPLKFISGNIGKQSYIDMQLMSMCKHNIIANSTFSWWGAWLNTNSNKIVIAPKRWFNDEKRNAQTKELVPENWIRI